jgi:hypothetical protein
MRLIKDPKIKLKSIVQAENLSTPHQMARLEVKTREVFRLKNRNWQAALFHRLQSSEASGCRLISHIFLMVTSVSN